MYDGLDENGMVNITHDATLILTLLQDLKGRFGLGKILLILRGSRSKELPSMYQIHPLFGKGAAKSAYWYKLIMENLQTQNYVHYVSMQSSFGPYSVLHISNKANEWLACPTNDREPIIVEPYCDILKYLKPKLCEKTSKNYGEGISIIAAQQTESQLCAGDTGLMKALLRLRAKLAGDLDVMPYMIASTTALNQLTERKPRNMEELKNCQLDGFYDMKYERFGGELLSCSQEFLTNAELLPMVTALKQVVNENEYKQEPLSQEPQPELKIQEELFAQVQDMQSEVSCTLCDVRVKIESAFQRKRRQSEDLWESDSDCNDESLTQIGNEIEKQLNTADKSCYDPDYELDLLLAEIEKMESEAVEQKQLTHKIGYVSSSELVLPRKKSTFEYIDSDDSDLEPEMTPKLR